MSCSRNRGLEIGIRADNGRFRCGNSAREGRRAMRGWPNVEFSTFHEGRGARKKTTPGGREKHAYFLDLKKTGKVRGMILWGGSTWSG